MKQRKIANIKRIPFGDFFDNLYKIGIARIEYPIDDKPRILNVSVIWR